MNTKEEYESAEKIRKATGNRDDITFILPISTGHDSVLIEGERGVPVSTKADIFRSGPKAPNKVGLHEKMKDDEPIQKAK